MANLAPTSANLGSTWAHLELTWAKLGPTSADLGTIGANLNQIGAMLGQFGFNLGQLGANFGHPQHVASDFAKEKTIFSPGRGSKQLFSSFVRSYRSACTIAPLHHCRNEAIKNLTRSLPVQF